ncbi:hypothetical protein DMUE_3789 [Dictyocoela muelleri]|nr:hypothetical protein DMUE_3789 [Dictyocoela muelleri]
MLENDQYKPSIFKKENWGIYDRILNFEPRTSNLAEAWHGVINDKIKITNPNIAFFIKKVFEIEQVNEIEIKQNKLSIVSWPRKNCEKEVKLFLLTNDMKYFDDDEFIENILKIYGFKLNKFLFFMSNF